MEEQAVDCPNDIGVEQFVYDENNSERSSRKFCNSTTLPRSEVVFFPSCNSSETHHRQSSKTTFRRSTW